MYFLGGSAGQKRYMENKDREMNLATLCWGFIDLNIVVLKSSWKLGR